MTVPECSFPEVIAEANLRALELRVLRRALDFNDKEFSMVDAMPLLEQAAADYYKEKCRKGSA